MRLVSSHSAHPFDWRRALALTFIPIYLGLVVSRPWWLFPEFTMPIATFSSFPPRPERFETEDMMRHKWCGAAAKRLLPTPR